MDFVEVSPWIPDQVRDDIAGGCQVFAVVPWIPASAGMTMDDGEAGS